MDITNDIINKAIEELNSSDTFYLATKDFSFANPQKENPRVIVGQLSKLEIFEKHSEYALKFSGKGLEMIADGYTDWNKYKNKDKPSNNWKWATILISILAIVPSYYAIYNDSKADKYKMELDQLKESHKAYADSIHSIENGETSDTLIVVP